MSLHQKHVEIRLQLLGTELSQHRRDLTPMVGGMTRQVLHKVRQRHLSCTDRKPSLQQFVCQEVHDRSSLTARLPLDRPGFGLLLLLR